MPLPKNTQKILSCVKLDLNPKNYLLGLKKDFLQLTHLPVAALEEGDALEHVAGGLALLLLQQTHHLHLLSCLL